MKRQLACTPVEIVNSMSGVRGRRDASGVYNQLAIGNRKSAILESHYSLNVSRRVDVLDQGALDRIERGVTVCD